MIRVVWRKPTFFQKPSSPGTVMAKTVYLTSERTLRIIIRRILANQKAPTASHSRSFRCPDAVAKS
jgi:hypothetical protein